MSITEKPHINKELVSWLKSSVESSKSWAKDQMSQFADKQSKEASFSLFTLVLIAIGAGVLFYYLYKWLRLLETPDNISRIARDSIVSQSKYANSNPNRIGIQTYLMQLKRSGVPDTKLVLTNFYVSTVNASGIFYPTVDGIVSPEAIRLATLAGARAFVFDIWPDLTPGAQFGPVIQIVESGSNWRRVSLNSLPLGMLFKILVEEAFQMPARPGYSDPLFLYLRFRGAPRSTTFDLTAQVLSAYFERYRLPNMYNRCRNQDKLFSTPITELLNKVVVVSSTNATGTMLQDYINIGPKAGIKIEYGVTEARGLDSSATKQAQGLILQNLAWVAPMSENKGNSWDFHPSMNLGIMFCAMDFWDNNEKLKKYLDPKMFGTHSFLLKPDPLCYILEILPNAPVPEHPGWDGSPRSGTPTSPPEIRLPSA
jgi:hypothetical protein